MGSGGPHLVLLRGYFCSWRALLAVLRGSYLVLGMETGLTTCKASPLPHVPSLNPRILIPHHGTCYHSPSLKFQDESRKKMNCLRVILAIAQPCTQAPLSIPHHSFSPFRTNCPLQKLLTPAPPALGRKTPQPSSEDRQLLAG